MPDVIFWSCDPTRDTIAKEGHFLFWKPHNRITGPEKHTTPRRAPETPSLLTKTDSPLFWIGLKRNSSDTVPSTHIIPTFLFSARSSSRSGILLSSDCDVTIIIFVGAEVLTPRFPYRCLFTTLQTALRCYNATAYGNRS